MVLKYKQMNYIKYRPLRGVPIPNALPSGIQARDQVLQRAYSERVLDKLFSHASLWYRRHRLWFHNWKMYSVRGGPETKCSVLWETFPRDTAWSKCSTFCMEGSDHICVVLTSVQMNGWSTFLVALFWIAHIAQYVIVNRLICERFATQLFWRKWAALLF